MSHPIKTIAIVGTGVIGASWAAFYASKGFTVKLYDVDPDGCRKGLEQARHFIDDLKIKKWIDTKTATIALDQMSRHDDFIEAIADIEMVQESIAEDYEIKKTLFKQLDAVLPPSVFLASSSSGLLMTEIQQVTRHPGRCLIAHPFNPPHLIPLVELVPGQATDPKTIDDMRVFFEMLGKTPVVLKKEAPGHIANRLAAALWREAIDIVLQGIASVEDVDKAVCAGPGLRWSLMGQHMIYHLGGGQGGLAHFIDHLGPAVESWLRDMATWTRLPQETKAVLMAGVEATMHNRSLEELMQWRDEKLIGIRKVIENP